MNTMTQKQKKSKMFRLGKNDRLSVGIDAHARSFHVAGWSGKTERIVGNWVQPAAPDELIRHLKPFKERIAQVVYEAGPTGFSLARRLRAEGFRARVIAPGHTPQTPADRRKSDGLDARKLAEYASKGLLKSVYVPAPSEEADRQVFRFREQMVRNRRRIRQQIKSFLLQHGVEQPEGLGHWSKRSIRDLGALKLGESLLFCLSGYLAELTHADAQVRRATAGLARLAGRDDYRRAAEVLQSVPGIGLITAMAFILELPRPRRFSNSRAVGRILGLCPQVKSSGETRHDCGRENTGNSRARTLLVEAAWRWVRRDLGAKAYYARMVHNTGNGKKAIVAVARRLGILLWRLALSGERYRPERAWCKPPALQGVA